MASMIRVWTAKRLYNYTRRERYRCKRAVETPDEKELHLRLHIEKDVELYVLQGDVSKLIGIVGTMHNSS